ncbi:4a-hydroxytetrahydrobiopterin dehydratase [Candidatus Absconditicoccus praedator]|uniref:4a-hydroxytetrahydrobiopterin dehydratase n=1 Tax=Candidatus Absconditicoccus praedator TaxID=2735562 RepID=UPI001E2F5A63|nr:4a-hydroxytetrahydrobiopterin dehydratase [Candidatus Absconditicoccus praedator]UFX82966.1 4a-hydroxytetrahydrobiopterin dehydratase [Candidatus Absconditicoccus praedator]
MDNWVKNSKSISKEFNFNSYLKGLEFAFKVGEKADQLDHHPQIIIEYKKVIVESTTHSTGGTVTEKDNNLAMEIDKIFESFNS